MLFRSRKELDLIRFMTKNDEAEVKSYLESLGSKDGYLTLDKSEKFKETYPLLSRDVGGKILEMIYKNKKEIFDLHVGYTKSILEWQLTHPNSKSLFALSSQMYTYSVSNQIIHEETDFSPLNFYGETKAMALELIREYRSKSRVKTSGLILFNHTSEFNNNK